MKKLKKRKMGSDNKWNKKETGLTELSQKDKII